MRVVARRFKVKHFKATAYRPQSNGSVERSHHVLWEYLKQYTRKAEWDKYLNLASFSYNTSIHEGTKFTPFELVFGHMARTSTEDPIPQDCKNESYTNYLTKLFNKIRDVQGLAKENLNAAKQRSKHYYDKKINPRMFNIGDYAYLLKEPRKNKLGDQYTGPYEIVEIYSNHNVRLKLSRDRTRVVHSDKLKICKGTPPTTTPR